MNRPLHFHGTTLTHRHTHTPPSPPPPPPPPPPPRSHAVTLTHHHHPPTHPGPSPHARRAKHRWLSCRRLLLRQWIPLSARSAHDGDVHCVGWQDALGGHVVRRAGGRLRSERLAGAEVSHLTQSSGALYKHNLSAFVDAQLSKLSNSCNILQVSERGRARVCIFGEENGRKSMFNKKIYTRIKRAFHRPSPLNPFHVTAQLSPLPCLLPFAWALHHPACVTASIGAVASVLPRPPA